MEGMYVRVKDSQWFPAMQEQPWNPFGSWDIHVPVVPPGLQEVRDGFHPNNGRDCRIEVVTQYSVIVTY